MLYNNNDYKIDMRTVLQSNIPFEKLDGCNVLITGASGMIGSFLSDILMFCNEERAYNINIFVMGRSEDRLRKRFETHYRNTNFHIIEQDVNLPLLCSDKFDYIIHAASNAYPDLFSKDPVGTIMGNIWGTYNLLEYARRSKLERFLFVSSGEVYGQGAENIIEFLETYSGEVDSTNFRSCYPNGKRAAETLCASYSQQYGLDTIIARPCHIFGPTLTLNDNRASSHFINEVLAGNDIIMKSQGSQLRSYCHVADCVSGILTILLKGENGNAYNIANSKSNITIRELAECIADISGKKVIFKLPDEVEKASFNPVTRSVLNSEKLEKLGWYPEYDLRTGLIRTIKILK
ncbi:NAD-dependent epimerase/dehydratase family protein [Paenibacillus sp. FSL H8-0332]|uniref:NAD-dependent epimerase/dehydratase family protein n=1 Tax=Paenibacillus sp. FSL H8-0332 TaxID=2954742 RepID=UPI0030D495C0